MVPAYVQQWLYLQLEQLQYTNVRQSFTDLCRALDKAPWLKPKAEVLKKSATQLITLQGVQGSRKIEIWISAGYPSSRSFVYLDGQERQALPGLSVSELIELAFQPPPKPSKPAGPPALPPKPPNVASNALGREAPPRPLKSLPDAFATSSKSPADSRSSTPGPSYPLPFTSPPRPPKSPNGASVPTMPLSASPAPPSHAVSSLSLLNGSLTLPRVPPTEAPSRLPSHLGQYGGQAHHPHPLQNQLGALQAEFIPGLSPQPPGATSQLAETARSSSSFVGPVPSRIEKSTRRGADKQAIPNRFSPSHDLLDAIDAPHISVSSERAGKIAKLENALLAQANLLEGQEQVNLQRLGALAQALDRTETRLDFERAALLRAKDALLRNVEVLGQSTMHAQGILQRALDKAPPASVKDVVVIAATERAAVEADASNRAIDELLRLLPKALDAGSVSLHVYLRLVRQYARDQFSHRHALLQRRPQPPKPPAKH